MTIPFPTSIAFVSRTIFLFCFLMFCKTSAQEISGEQLLEKAIHYHDPKGNWDQFKGKLSVGMKGPKVMSG